MFFPWDELPYEEEWYGSGFYCPAACLENFTVPGTREVKQLYEGNAGDSSGRWAVTFMTPQLSIGSFTSSELWDQRRPMLAYVNNNGAPAYIRLRCLHDGYDYCSARMKSSQNRGDLLLGIDFLTDGGDTHPNLDRISGAIEAEDLRLRVEIGGCLDGITARLTDEGAVFRIGETGFCLTTWLAVFAGQPETGRSLRWQIERTADSMHLDMLLYSGPRTVIDFASLRQAAFVFSLIAGEDRAGRSPRMEAAGEGWLAVSRGAASGGGFSLRLRPGPAADGNS